MLKILTQGQTTERQQHAQQNQLFPHSRTITKNRGIRLKQTCHGGTKTVARATQAFTAKDAKENQNQNLTAEAAKSAEETQRKINLEESIFGLPRKRDFKAPRSHTEETWENKKSKARD
jgi:glutaredoxin 2